MSRDFLPRQDVQLVDETGRASNPFYVWLQSLDAVLKSGATIPQIEAKLAELQALIDSIPTSGFLPNTTNVFGQNSIATFGTLANGIVLVQLQGDAPSPYPLQFYGVDSDRVRGWQWIHDALAAGDGLVRTMDGFNVLGVLPWTDDLPVSADVGDAYLIQGRLWAWDGADWIDEGDASGVTMFALAPLPDTGEGALLAITRDQYGRIEGSKPATITGTAGQIDVANGDAVAGLPTISLADLADAGGGTFKLLTRDAKGRLSGTSDGDTDDVPEGSSNLYFTAARVLGTILAGLSTATNAAITAADSVLSAFGKLQAQITALSASLSGYVPASRTISTTAPLTGGGDLSANRTLSIAAATTSAAGSMSGADKTKLDGIAAGATLGATWGANLAGIPANITSWAAIAPTEKWDASLAHSANLGTNNPAVDADLNSPLGGDFKLIRAGASTANRPIGMLGGGMHFPIAPTGGGQGGQFLVRANTTQSDAWIRSAFAGVWAPWAKLIVDNQHFLPAADATYNAGSATFRFLTLFAQTGTINTSDAREKSNVRGFTPDELAAASALAALPRIYQWNDAIATKGVGHARLHCSPTVQSVIACLESHGLDPMRYGFVCYDAWEEEPELRDEATGEVMQAHRPAGDRYSLRPDQLHFFIARGQEERLRRLEQAAGL